ncbi:conserved hypothetical protein [Histoplasma mississippiense (nom. inval.)]|uniref:conserved hypothetical protein n=1 Tax=Ajellomyces capsulatus (strain NAm1 / WU24) TaxID=2059318 RepID=UPI000157C8C2|nr:conserved hypothetical protein [Histoplasma mississippiense (nom. inval.)]EDN09419.1 conserved hypothetical protein [Histoplasma mississippiense (nom. inval.)]
MPRERQKRGRRAEAKRKRGDEAGDHKSPKRQKASDGYNDSNPPYSQAKIGDDYIPLEEGPASSMDAPFYGLLDAEEQEYFSRAGGLLELNQFETEEEKDIFIERVYEEADGKELKIACSQSCSRLMERLISASTDLFLTAISELEGNWGYLLTDRFASHTIRVLLLILAGEQLDSPSKSTVIASRKKENLDKAKVVTQPDRSGRERRAVPPSFNAALEKMVKDLIAGLDNTYLRALATHPVGNPVLQVLLSIELTHLGKSKAKDPDSIFRRLVPDENLEEGSESAGFIKGLFYDPVGSRLLETIVLHAPGKFFKTFYKAIVLERIGSLSRNEIAGHVVARILERLSKEDLKSAMDLILPEVPSLAERSRLTVIKVLIERSVVRGVDLAPLADTLLSSYGTDPASRINNILKLQYTKEENDSANRPSKGSSPEQLHGSLLAQAMLKSPGPLSELIQASLIAITPESLMAIAKDPIASHVLQDALTLPTSTARFRRQITSRFSGKMAELALDSSGSHVADALWSATEDLVFVKQRFAEELLANEQALRDSFVGRAVWRNWSMDLYKRRRGNWISMAKGREHSAKVELSKPDHQQCPKSNIDQARARFAAKADGSKASANSSMRKVSASTA